jgi:hypothetical protein
MNVIMTTPLSTATPAAAMNPMPALMEKGIPRKNSRRMPPAMANGMPVNASAARLSEMKKV